MPVIMVAYDLKKPGKNYLPVYEYLSTFSMRAPRMASLWLLQTDLPASSICDDLNALVDKDDVIFVTELEPHGWISNNREYQDWLAHVHRHSKPSLDQHLQRVRRQRR